MKNILFGVLTLLSSIHAAGAVQCKGSDQLYAGVCVTQRMSDYLVCIEKSGGNKSELTSIVEKSSRHNTDAAASVSATTRGKLVQGSSSFRLNRKNELDVIKQAETKFFPEGVSNCAQLAAMVKAQPTKITAPRFPITRTATGLRVVFFDDFAVEIESISKAGVDPMNVELRTPENGNVRFHTGQQPIDVSYKGKNYFLSAKEEDGATYPILILNNR